MQHDLVTTGILAAFPAAFLVQLLKWMLARYVEPVWGKARWDALLRLQAALIGTVAGFLIRGDIAGAAAGMGGGLACTAILAAVFRLARTWSPTGGAPQDESTPPDDPEVP